MIDKANICMNGKKKYIKPLQIIGNNQVGVCILLQVTTNLSLVK